MAGLSLQIGLCGVDQLRPDLRPIVGAEIFAGDCTGGGLLDGYTDFGTELLIHACRLADISDRRAAGPVESRSFFGGESVDVGDQFFHGSSQKMQMAEHYKTVKRKSIPFGVLLAGNKQRTSMPMSDSGETDVVARRRLNLKAWIDERFKGVQAAFVDKTGINQGELSGLLKKKSFGEKKARALEKQAGMPDGWLDSIHDNEEPATLSADDQQILSAADFMPPDRLASMIEQVKQARNSKGALLAKLLEIQREGEKIEPPPRRAAPDVHESPGRTQGKPYKLPEPGIARPHAGHHKKRTA